MRIRRALCRCVGTQIMRLAIGEEDGATLDATPRVVLQDSACDNAAAGRSLVDGGLDRRKCRPTRSSFQNLPALRGLGLLRNVESYMILY